MVGGQRKVLRCGSLIQYCSSPQPNPTQNVIIKIATYFATTIIVIINDQHLTRSKPTLPPSSNSLAPLQHPSPLTLSSPDVHFCFTNHPPFRAIFFKIKWQKLLLTLLLFSLDGQSPLKKMDKVEKLQTARLIIRLLFGFASGSLLVKINRNISKVKNLHTARLIL